MATKAEISWKRVNEDGEKIQVNAQRVSREWKFSQRSFGGMFVSECTSTK